MTVFTSRISRSYLKKRSRKQKFSATLVLLAIAGAFVFAATQADRDDKLISGLLWPLHCCHVVGGHALSKSSFKSIYEPHVGQQPAHN